MMQLLLMMMMMVEMEEVGMVLVVEVGGAGILFRITTTATADYATERGRAIVRRLEVMMTAVVELVDLLEIPDPIVHRNLQVGHALHFRVLIHRPQREPVIFVVILVQVLPLDRDLPVRFILLQVPIAVPHVHRQVPEVAGDLELVLLAEERAECPLDRRRPADFLLVQGDRAVHVAVFLRAR